MLKLEASEKLNQERQIEILTLKRVQNEQGRALEKMVNENDYPRQFKNLMDDLRFKKDKIREHEETIR